MRRIKIVAFFILFLLLFVSGISFSQNNNSEDSGNLSLEQILEGFDEIEGDSESSKAVQIDQTALEGGISLVGKLDHSEIWDFSGNTAFRSTYNYAHNAPKEDESDHRYLSSLRLEMNMGLKARFSSDWYAYISGRAFRDFIYDIKDRNRYPDEFLDTYEEEAELQEAYVQGTLSPNLDLKIGRQITVWGKSDHIRITDVLNPIDLCEPGLVNIEDLRLPLTMTRVDLNFSQANLTALMIHEIRFHKNPVFGSDFYPSSTLQPDERIPEHGGENTEYGVALSLYMHGWELSLYGARFFDDNPHFVHIAQGFPPTFELQHSRLNMRGFAVNVVLGSWVLKTEAAYMGGLEFFNIPDISFSRLDILGGIEYSGIKNTLITLEAANRHLFDFDSRLEDDPDNAIEDDTQIVLRFQQDFLNETLHLSTTVMNYGLRGEGGSYQCFSVDYDVADAFTVTCGLINYISGDRKAFEDIGNNDRIFLKLKRSF